MVIHCAFEHAHGRLCTSPAFVHHCVLCHARGHTHTERQKRQRDRETETTRETPITHVLAMEFRTVGTIQKRGILTGRKSDATSSGRNKPRTRRERGSELEA